MLARVTILAALIALSPAAGCKKLLAKARGASDDATPDQSAQAAASGAPQSAPPGMASSATSASLPGTRPTSTAPAADALLALGTGEWVTYAPDGPQRFTVLLPQKPQETLRDVRVGAVSTQARQAGSSRVGAVYTFLTFDLPPAARTDARGTLDAARDDAVRTLPSAVLKAERDIQLGKNPGREFQAEATASFPMLLTGHVYLVGRRVYEQLITVPSSVSEGSYVDKYFGSLTVPGEGSGAQMSDAPTPSPSASPAASAKKKR